MAKRVLLFLGVNFLVIMTISVIFSVCGIRPYITQHGLDIPMLAAFCGIYGMGGAFISLWVSRAVAKFIYGIELVHGMSPDPKHRELVATVHQFAKMAKLPEMPEVGIYQSKDMNAFATGPTKSKALVAVSSELLDKMNKDQLAGVLAHEVSHIANDDMVTMTLLQGVVNAFVMFMSRAIAYAVTIARDDEEGHLGNLSYYLVRVILELVFMALGGILVCWFSRQREYRADAGGAQLAGANNMAAALQFLRMHDGQAEQALRRGQPMSAMMIAGTNQGILAALYSTHPPLEDRISRLIGGSDSGIATDIVGGDLPQRSADSSRSANSLRDRFGKNDKI